MPHWRQGETTRVPDLILWSYNQGVQPASLHTCICIILPLVHSCAPVNSLLEQFLVNKQIRKWYKLLWVENGGICWLLLAGSSYVGSIRKHSCLSAFVIRSQCFLWCSFTLVASGSVSAAAAWFQLSLPLSSSHLQMNMGNIISGPHCVTGNSVLHWCWSKIVLDWMEKEGSQGERLFRYLRRYI